MRALIYVPHPLGGRGFVVPHVVESEDELVVWRSDETRIVRHPRRVALPVGRYNMTSAVVYATAAEWEYSQKDILHATEPELHETRNAMANATLTGVQTELARVRLECSKAKLEVERLLRRMPPLGVQRVNAIALRIFRRGLGVSFEELFSAAAALHCQGSDQLQKRASEPGGFRPRRPMDPRMSASFGPGPAWWFA